MGQKKLTKKRKKILNELKEWFKDRSIDDFITMGVGLWAAKHTNQPLNALHGMIGYKLARAPNIPASMVGIGILAAVGIGGLPMQGQDTVMIQPPEEEDPPTCPEGSVRKWSILGGWQCVKVHP